MKKNSLLITGLVLTSLIVYFACRKIDRAFERDSGSIENSFFTNHTARNKEVLAVQGYLRRAESKYHFVRDLVARIGMPYWDKALVMQDGTGQVYHRSNSGDTAVIVYLPFVRPGETFVNASMMIKMAPEDTSWLGLCDWQYDGLGYDTTTNDHWNARDAFNIFATMNNAVFGYDTFDVMNGEIFGKDQNDTLMVTLDPSGDRTEALVFNGLAWLP